MVDGAVDFMVMILLLVVVTAVSFNVILPIVHDSENLKYDEIYDKTAEYAKGEQANASGDGCMSPDEIIVTVMSQSFFMPKPRIMDVCGLLMTVKKDRGNGYTNVPGIEEIMPGAREPGVEAANKLKSWINNYGTPYGGWNGIRLKFAYTVNKTTGSKGSYAVFVKCNKGCKEGVHFHRCLSNGVGSAVY